MAKAGEMTAASNDLLARDADLTDAEFFAECDAILARFHTISRPLSHRRRDRLRRLKEQGRREGRVARWVAEHLGHDPNRFSKLTSLKAVAQ